MGEWVGGTNKQFSTQGPKASFKLNKSLQSALGTHELFPIQGMSTVGCF